MDFHFTHTHGSEKKDHYGESQMQNSEWIKNKQNNVVPVTHHW